jgi:hypothetical protein
MFRVGSVVNQLFCILPTQTCFVHMSNLPPFALSGLSFWIICLDLNPWTWFTIKVYSAWGNTSSHDTTCSWFQAQDSSSRAGHIVLQTDTTVSLRRVTLFITWGTGPSGEYMIPGSWQLFHSDSIFLGYFWKMYSHQWPKCFHMQHWLQLPQILLYWAARVAQWQDWCSKLTSTQVTSEVVGSIPSQTYSSVW